MDIQSRLFDMVNQMNASFLNRLESIDRKMSRLDPIEREINLVRDDITSIKKDNSELSRKVNEMEKTCETISSLFDSSKQNSDKINVDIKNIQKENSLLKEEIESINSKYTKVQDELLDLKTRSMQENLLLFGLSEPSRDQEENVEFKVRDFLKNELEVTEQRVDEIVFDRVHRLGRPRPQTSANPRPIVVKFEKYTDREYIRKAGIALNEKRNGYSIREQYPKEIEDKRKSLYPIMRRLKQDPNNRVSLVRDKLYINGSLYTGPVPGSIQTYTASNNDGPINSQPNLTSRSRQTRQQLRAQRNHSVSRERDILLNNPFQLLQDDDSFTTDRQYGKRKANSPLTEETENKKCNDVLSRSDNFTYSEIVKQTKNSDSMDTGEAIHNSPGRQNTSEQLSCPDNVSQPVITTSSRDDSVSNNS